MKADLLTLPYPDGSVDRIAAIHVFEHFYRWDADKFLAECKRVLKSGGTLVLELPCMDRVFNHIFVRMKKDEAPAPAFSWFALWGDPKHEDPAMVHKWGYFLADMFSVLKEAGFENIQHEEARYHFPTRDMRFSSTKP